MIHTDFAELSDATLLRQRAHAIVHEQTGLADTGVNLPKHDSTPPATCDLDVHQIELKLQNEELRIARSALKASRERYLDLYDFAPVGYCTLDTQGLILRGNLKAATLLGLPCIGLLKRHFSNFIFKEDQCQYTSLQERLLTTRQPQDCELRMLDGNGAPFWANLLANFAESEDGGAVLRVVVTDISARKLAESELRRAASVFTHSGEGIMITSSCGAIVDVNDAFCRITGYTREEVIGKNPRLFTSGRQSADFYRAFWAALTTNGHWCGEIWNKRKCGEEHAELLTINAVLDAFGETQQYVALFSDITALKEYQRQLEHIAHFDALTHLPNRLLFADRLKQAMAQAQRRGQQLALVYLDLDGFKAINDRCGHDVGDQMLVHLATAMAGTLREGDTLARIGGDEFVAVLVDLQGQDSCVPMLTRFLAAAALPLQFGSALLQGSISIGVTFYPQAHNIEADQLLRQADQAMYQAKLAGKNRYHVFNAAHDNGLRVQH